MAASTEPLARIAREMEDAGVPAAGANAVAAAVLEWTSNRVDSKIRATAARLLEDANELLAFADSATETFEAWRGSPGLAQRYRDILEDLVAFGPVRSGHDEPGRHTQRPGLVRLAGYTLPAVQWSDMPTVREVLLVLVVLMLQALGVPLEADVPDGNGFDIAARILKLAGLKASEDTKRQYDMALKKLGTALAKGGYAKEQLLTPQHVYDGYRRLAGGPPRTEEEPDA